MSEKKSLLTGVYRHFKGNLYRVLYTGRHSETKEWYVVYMSVESGDVWVRPFDMFVSSVDKEKYPYAIQKYRFEYVGE